MYVTKTPSSEVEEVGCRQSLRPPSILWFGGCCSSTHIAVLTTSLRALLYISSFLSEHSCQCQQVANPNTLF